MARRFFTVALVGRPNVGKSAIFNRICRRKIAIVEDIEGVTRDPVQCDLEIGGRSFSLIDTGGIDFCNVILFSESIRDRVHLSIEKADAIILVVDGLVGVTVSDESVVRWIFRKFHKSIVLAVNKIDNFQQEDMTHDFYSLGIQSIVEVSALHGHGISNLLEKTMVSYFSPIEAEEDKEGKLKISVIGRPNVGKSTLLNAFLRESRCIVSDVPGTTRDSIHYETNRHIFIDTAGLRRKQKESSVLDKYARMRVEKAIEESDISILVIDVQDGITAYEKHLLAMLESNGKGVILFVNKWDLVRGCMMERIIADIRNNCFSLKNFPIVIGSAEKGRNICDLLNQIDRVHQNLFRRIPTSELNTFLSRVIKNYPPLAVQGKMIRMYYFVQVGVNPVQFVIFVNDPLLFPRAYKRHLINQLYHSYDFLGCPLHVKLKGRTQRRRG